MAAIYGRPIDLAALLESQQPEVDLKIKDFEASTRNFLKAVSLYTSRAIEEISSRKTRHAAELKKSAEKRQQAEVEITACKVKEIKLMEVLEKEQAEKKDSESSVNELKRQFGSIKEKCSTADVEIEQYREEVESLRREKTKDMNMLNKHANRTSPELEDLESLLQCVMEGVEGDKILVRFPGLDPLERQREFSLVIDVSSLTYKVPITTPPLPTLPLLVDHLNSSRDIYTFIKTVRQAFQDFVDLR
ncbi:hypothetical protein SCHPADRAFT_920100 [Schizopora paradoxa]|uniref:Kinetochore protein SPC25 n=1 Tax=Schizopora paradoxa TaxID=27342 RepID=A0A0H2RV79_9AGAM|nr:hypothetical protein SCHPADRAFT_920100 [Schizopora paradoxa]